MKMDPKTQKLTIETLTRTVTGILEMHNRPVTRFIIEVWQRVLCDLTEYEFDKGVMAYMTSADSAFPPQPGQIYALARPEMDKRGEAMLLSERIMVLLGNCGSDSAAVNRAKERLPEVAWAYIENIGGWSKFSRSMQSDVKAEVVKAHIRDSIVNLIDRKKAGRPLLLSQDSELISISDQMKNILSQGALPDVPHETN